MMQSGVKTLAHLLSRAGLDNLTGVYEGGASASAERDESKKLDVIAVSFPVQFLPVPEQCYNVPLAKASGGVYAPQHQPCR